MLRILGSPKKLCNGWTRRELLTAAGLGALGFGASALLPRADGRTASVAPRSFGKAKSCILLYLYGSPSQLETFDPKPDAPEEIRGELGSIRSSLPGADVGELLPLTSRVMDRVTVVRSMTHPYPIHGVAYALTGVPQIDVPMELNPHDGRHWPFIGSVVDYLGRRAPAAPARPVPTNLALPFPFSSRRVGEVARAGPYSAFLGGAYNPVWTEFRGEATRRIVKTLQQQKLDVGEPYVGVSADGRFEIAGAADSSADLTLDRLDARRTLVEQFDQGRLDLDASDAGRGRDRFRDMAYDLIHSDKVRTALDLGREPAAVRDSYGLTLFGQASLAARRLVEAGSRFVSVFWDEFGLAGSAWDTHWEHFPRMKNELCPGFDRAFAGLIADLDGRGMLDDTLVLLLSEHGRTPKLQNGNGGGRDHWSRCYSAVLAGAGIARGRVVGKSDKIAGDVAERPVSPKDVLATAYHLLGIDHATTLTDRGGRPVPLISEGTVLTDVLA
jgi:Protein of unknown function (DUF1501)